MIRYMKHFLSLLLLALPFLSTAQPKPTPAADRLAAYQLRKNMQGNSLLAQLEAQSIGPSIFSCRVTDVDANPADPTEMYVAYASGGLWYSHSNGTRFEPVFDHEATMTIGDIAVDWDRRIIWVGAGENNSSRSSYAGTGLYRSADGGQTWEQRGLTESHHIGRIAIHPNNPNILWVAALGHLYSPNAERGVFRSTDGGQTWSRTLFVNENAGAIDLVVDPGNNDVLYAATWQRSRQPWHFNGAGEGSGIWKSIDGGQTWNRINTAASGFPFGPTVGRIGLAAGRKNGKTVLYASLDNQAPKPKKDTKEDALSKDQLRTITAADFDKLPDAKLEKFLRDNDFPEKYTVQSVKTTVKKGDAQPLTLVEYLEDANTKLFEANYIGAEVYRSDDGGQSWQKTHIDPLDNIHFTYGYYFSNIRCATDDPDKVYLLGFYIVRSDDGGKSWIKINGDNVHVDHHALWINPIRPGHLINGNDGGLNISWDDGASWMLCNNPPVGQFYAIAADQAEPYNVYGGAQDNGVWVGPSTYKTSDGWHQDGQYPYKMLLGGDGMQIAIDNRNNNTVYTGYQFGNYFRLTRDGSIKPKSIQPKHALGERPHRFNWQTPIHLSSHNQDILYLGAHKLYRSFDQGNHWDTISGDLTRGPREGNVPYGTLTSVHESPLQFGLLYTGSDDGLVHVSRDGGLHWKRISDSLPANLWVSRVVASAHERARAYVTLNGYRYDHFSPYLYRTDNYGGSWIRIGTDLPSEPVNVVREDPANPDLLYVGTDHGVYVSLDRGSHFQALSKGLPDVPVHDLAIQPTAKDLLVGTHGRSLFKIPIGPLQGMTPALMAKTLHIFPLEKVKYRPDWGKKRPWEAQKDPEQRWAFYSKAAGKTLWRVETEDGLLLKQGESDAQAGLNYLMYPLDLTDDAAGKLAKKLEKADPQVTLTKADSGKYYLPKGKYKVILKQGTTTSTETLEIQ
jgi:photosystem II stability/assembly factor-like uncharacterized protein